MKKSVTLPECLKLGKSKFYTFDSLDQDGQKTVFCYIYDPRTRKFRTDNFYIYIENGVFLPNTFHFKTDVSSSIYHSLKNNMITALGSRF
jgi:hypothetical protein